MSNSMAGVVCSRDTYSGFYSSLALSGNDVCWGKFPSTEILSETNFFLGGGEGVGATIEIDFQATL